MSNFELYTRVAWLNRDSKEYKYDAWHPFTQKNPKEYKNLQIWIQKQNKNYPRTKYWIEMKSTEDNIVKNSETYEMMMVPSQHRHHECTPKKKRGIKYTDWLVL